MPRKRSKSAPHVVMLTSVHPPFDIRIFKKECVSISEAGLKVTFIVPHNKDEHVQGVQIRSVSKPKSRAHRMTKTIWSVYCAALRAHGDIYHFHDPELIPIGILLKLQGKRVIYDVHEDVPNDLRGKSWILSPIRRPLAAVISIFEVLSARIFDGVFATTSLIASRFPSRKTILVQNFAIMDEFAPSDNTSYCDRPPIVAYVGHVSEARGAKVMIRAMDQVNKSIGLRMKIAGPFDSSLAPDTLRLAASRTNVEFLGPLNREDVSTLLTNSRIGIVTFLPIRGHANSMPNKLFEYMTASLPVIASDFPLWRPFVEESCCGLLVDPADPEAIARAMEWLIEHPDEAEAMGKRGQDAARNQFSWNAEANRMIDFYRGLLRD